MYMEAGWGLSAFIAMKTQPCRIFGMQQKQLVLRVKFMVIQASLKKKKKERKISNKQPKLPTKRITKRKTKPTVRKRKEIIKIRGNK